jgi:hypothetical protein
MNWMRAEIVGKDDEKFLGDEPETPALKASTEAPARPQPTAKTGATVSAPKPLNGR